MESKETKKFEVPKDSTAPTFVRIEANAFKETNYDNIHRDPNYSGPKRDKEMLSGMNCVAFCEEHIKLIKDFEAYLTDQIGEALLGESLGITVVADKTISNLLTKFQNLRNKTIVEVWDTQRNAKANPNS